MERGGVCRLSQLRARCCAPPAAWVAISATVALLALIPAAPLRAANSIWVKVGASGRLQYLMDDTGDRIMDYSTVGYKGGLVPLPDYTTLGVPTINVSPVAGDNLSALQAAINQAAALPLKANGFRGVVQLAPGTYPISAGLAINSSGIVFRGSGNGGNPAVDSILSYTGTSQIDMVHVDSSASRSNSNTHNIADKVVPVGVTSFTVDSTAGYAVGDNIQINRPSPANWIHDIEMDTLDMPWTAGSKNQSYDRKVVYIDQTRKRIFFDAPLPNSFDQQYGGGTLSKTTFNRTTNVGIENLRGDGQAVLTTPTDEAHANSFVVMQDTADSWARNITGQHLVYATMEAGTGSRNITLDGGTSIDPISQITGGRRYPFNIEGQFVLMKNMTSDQGRHEFVNNSPSRGPNVFLDGVATNGHADSGTHQRWSTGTLWDNITTNTDINVQNRGNWGTGHGWSGANMVVWNSKASDFYVQNPETAQNWLIGSTGTVHSTSQNWPGSYPAYYDANNTGSKVTLNGETSLYRAQLAERMAHQRDIKLEYWVGDFDSYTNDGASDNVAVDAAWTSAVNALHPAIPKAGFDTPLTGGNIEVPFTMNYDVPGRIGSATLTMAVHAVGTAAGDQIYVDSTGNAIPFSSLGTLQHFGNSDIVTLEFLPNSSTLPLSLLQDGKLNMLVSSNHVLDWADLQLTVGGKNMTWTGSASATWDVQTTLNWNNGAASDVYFDGDFVTFGSGPTNRTVTISGTVLPGSVTVNNPVGADYTIGGGVIGGAANLTKQGAGSLTLTSANTYTGVTTISGGTIIAPMLANGGTNSSIGAATSDPANLVLDGGGLRWTGGASLSIDRGFTLTPGGGTIDSSPTAASTNLTIAGIIAYSGTGARTLTLAGTDQNPDVIGGNNLNSIIADAAGQPTTLVKNGNNAWVLGGVNSYSGGSVVNAGRLRAAVAGAFGTGPVSVASGGQAYIGTGSSFSNNFSISGLGITERIANESVYWPENFGALRLASNGAAVTGTITLTGDARITARGASGTGATIFGQITGGFGLEFNNIGGGTGILILNSAANLNNWTGTTTISHGTVRLGGNEQIPNGIGKGNVVINGSSSTTDALFDLNGKTETINGLSSSGDLTHAKITNTSATAATLTIGDGNASGNFGGSIQNGTGAVGIIKIGSGTQIFSGANTYTGDTQINIGTLQLGAADRIADAARLNLQGGTFATGGFNETLGRLGLGSNSSIDLGVGASVLHFADSHTESWSGLLSIANWDGRWGASGGGTVDKLFVSANSSGLTATQLGEINFAGFAPGAMILSTGEVVPIAPARGDFNLDHVVDPNDVTAMLSALTDLNAYAASNNLTAADLLAIGDLDHDNQITNADIQPLLNALASGIQPVPEPSALLTLAIGAAIASAIAIRRRRLPLDGD